MSRTTPPARRTAGATRAATPVSPAPSSTRTATKTTRSRNSRRSWPSSVAIKICQRDSRIWATPAMSTHSYRCKFKYYIRAYTLCAAKTGKIMTKALCRYIKTPGGVAYSLTVFQSISDLVPQRALPASAVRLGSGRGRGGARERYLAHGRKVSL